jgi:ATP phosphoribosyltransferase
MTVVVDAGVAFAVITVVTTGTTLVVNGCVAVRFIIVVAPCWVAVAFAGTDEERELMEAAREELEKYGVLVFVDTNSVVLVLAEATVVALEFA